MGGIGINKSILVQHYGVGGWVVVVSFGGLCGGDLRFFVVCYGGNCGGGAEKDECLDLKTKGTGTLNLIQNFLSWMKNFGTVSSRSCLIGFNFTQSRLGLVLICISIF